MYLPSSSFLQKTSSIDIMINGKSEAVTNQDVAGNSKIQSSIHAKQIKHKGPLVGKGLHSPLETHNQKTNVYIRNHDTPSSKYRRSTQESNSSAVCNSGDDSDIDMYLPSSSLLHKISYIDVKNEGEFQGVINRVVAGNSEIQSSARQITHKDPLVGKGPCYPLGTRDQNKSVSIIRNHDSSSFKYLRCTQESYSSTESGYVGTSNEDVSYENLIDENDISEDVLDQIENTPQICAFADVRDKTSSQEECYKDLIDDDDISEEVLDKIERSSQNYYRQSVPHSSNTSLQVESLEDLIDDDEVDEDVLVEMERNSQNCSVQNVANSSGTSFFKEKSFEDLIDEDEFPEDLLHELERGTEKPCHKSCKVYDVNRCDRFEQLPSEILENIFCRLPILDLYMNCMTVCKRWKEFLSHPKFIPWKKKYFSLKRNDLHSKDEMSRILQEEGMMVKDAALGQLIRYMSKFKRMTRHSAFTDIQKHAKHETARDLIQQKYPDLFDNETPNVWSIVATLVILAHSVQDIQSVMECLLREASPCPVAFVIECFYCICTMLLALQKQHNLNRGLHFRVYYALYLFENDAEPPAPRTHPQTPNRPRTSSELARVRLPEVRLTYEQIRIINHKLNERQHETIKIVAFAGTGKTTTLVHFAKARPRMRFLYVAFNKSVQQQASKVFPSNVECKTTHSLAWKEVGVRYATKLSRFISPYDIYHLLKGRRRSSRRTSEQEEKGKIHWTSYTKLVLTTIGNFTSSNNDFVTSLHVPERYSTSRGNFVLEHKDRMDILADAEFLWKRMVDLTDEDTQIPHDGYFKLYQLSKPDIPDVDCILIDEAQDLTRAQQDVLLRQQCNKILVGDPHQQIYSFRGATNAMTDVRASCVYYLSQSFRFGPLIAYTANCILDVLKNVTEQTIVGTNRADCILGSQMGQVAIICRCNATLFQEAVQLCMQDNIKIGFAGGISGYFFKSLLNLYYFYRGSGTKTFYGFKSFTALREYSFNVIDKELLTLVAIILQYGNRIPHIVSLIREKNTANIQDANVVLSTVHKAKGMEFDTVKLATDFISTRPRADQDSDENRRGGEDQMEEDQFWNIAEIPDDEKNLLYVAVTRAKKCLILNEAASKCFKMASEEFKIPVSSKSLLADVQRPHCCLDCHRLINDSQQVLVVHVQEVKKNPRTRPGGYLCGACSSHQLPGFANLLR